MNLSGAWSFKPNNAYNSAVNKQKIRPGEALKSYLKSKKENLCRAVIKTGKEVYLLFKKLTVALLTLLGILLLAISAGC
jgi:hypothetical protein